MVVHGEGGALLTAAAGGHDLCKTDSSSFHISVIRLGEAHVWQCSRVVVVAVHLSLHHSELQNHANTHPCSRACTSGMSRC